MENEKKQALAQPDQESCRNCPQNRIKSWFALSVVAVILSCFTGFWCMPLALAALILSLRTQDLIQSGRTDEARSTAWWAALFGWLTILIALLPVILVLFFGGAILAFITALIAAA